MAFTIEEMRRRQSLALVKMKPVMVTLQRQDAVSDGAGGNRKGTTEVLPEQLMRLAPADAVGNEAPMHTTADGRTVTPNWYLICPFGTDVLVGDKANDVQGHDLEVVFISSAPTERIVAQCWEEDPDE